MEYPQIMSQESKGNQQLRNGEKPMEKLNHEQFSDFSPKESIFVQNCNHTSENTGTRAGFIEPCGYVTRLPFRQDVLGSDWFNSSDVGANCKRDLQLDPEARRNLSGKGDMTWTFEAEKENSKEQCYDDIVSHHVPSQGKTDLMSLIGQLSPLNNEAENATCAAFVCAENEFLTHAPYMAIKGSDVIYSVWFSPKDVEWSREDLKLWWKREPEQQKTNYTFGNFKKVPLTLTVPHELNVSFNDSFIDPLIMRIEKMKENLPADCAIMEVTLAISEGHLCLKTPEPDSEMFKLAALSQSKSLSWPVNVLRNRYFLTGAPASLSVHKSRIPEVNEFIAELEKYKGNSTQALQLKAWMIFSLERALEMYTAQRLGKASADNGNFIVHEVDYSKVYQPPIHPAGKLDCSKGSGLPMLTGNPYYNAICESLGLNGFSTSPMVLANSLQYNRFVYGKSMGTPLGVGDCLFFFDYGGDRTMPLLRTWIEGLGERLARLHSAGDAVGKLLLEINIMNYEYIRAKKRYEDSMRRAFVKVQHICTWKDIRELLHYRAVDAAFAKVTMTSSLDEEGHLAIGFVGLIHDVIDYGYDLSVCECSNTLYSFGAVDGSLASLERVYAIILAGLKYLAKVHRYASSGLCAVSTHYWQLCNGRHRVLNCAMSVAQHSFPPVLQIKETLLGTILDRPREEFRSAKGHDHENCQKKYNDLLPRAEVLGKAYPNLLKAIVAKPYERIYGKSLDPLIPSSLREADNIPLILDCVCIDSSDEGVELLWDIALFMYDETAIMWHAMLGSLLVVADRMVGDDSAGYGYERRPWTVNKEQ